MTIGIIVQARMSSQRLPGKVLRDLGGKPMLLYTLERVALAHGVDGVIVATSDETSDDPIAAFCADKSIPCFRGSLVDVAGRFFAAADAHEFDAFVRVCGDSPLTDPAVISTAVALFRGSEYDLVTNTFPRSFPVGVSVEVVRTEPFRRAHVRMTDPLDREHVTRYYYQHPEEFRIKNFSASHDNSTAQLAVDTVEDWERFVRIVQQMERSHTAYHYEEILAMVPEGERGGTHSVH
ncbi:MAG: glycosyltransferase family protein [bacterium]|nr:glycosyltransferase family protein [bacterium]